MIDLKDTSLMDMLPPNLKMDPDVRATCAAIDLELKNLANEIRDVLTFGDIDNAQSNVVDNLAKELNTDYYDMSLSLDMRRELVKNALTRSMAKGTVFAIENVITTLFGDGKVEEWFEYNGDPYYFRVLTDNSSVTAELADQFNEAVDKAKNYRSRLEVVIITMSGEMNLYFGNALQTGDNITIEQVV